MRSPNAGLIVVGVMAYYGRGDDPVRGADVRRSTSPNWRRRWRCSWTQGTASCWSVVTGSTLTWRTTSGRLSLLTCPGLPDDAVLVRDVATFTQLTDEMMRAEVVIASRFHNLICALRLARPTVSVGYAEKNRHLMQALGLGDYCQDIEHLDANELVAQVRAAG